MANLTLADIQVIADQKERDSALLAYHRNSELELRNQLRDLSIAVTHNADHAAVQYALNQIPFYNGTSPIKEFIQDIENYRFTVRQDAETEKSFVRGLMSKLKGKARNCLDDTSFQTVNELVKHLKTYFAPSRSYSYYVNSIINSCMKRNESARDFHDRLSSLIRGALAAIRENLADAHEDVDQRPHLEVLALEAYIRGLPDDWRMAVLNAAPATFTEALEIAIKIEKYHYMGSTNQADVHHTYAQRHTDEMPHRDRNAYRDDYSSREDRYYDTYFPQRPDNRRRNTREDSYSTFDDRRDHRPNIRYDDHNRSSYNYHRDNYRSRRDDHYSYSDRENPYPRNDPHKDNYTRHPSPYTRHPSPYTRHPSPYNPYRDRGYSPARSPAPENSNSWGTRYADINDANTYNRHNMNYTYDSTDTHFPHTKITPDGKILAAPQLGYSQPASILKSNPNPHGMSPPDHQEPPRNTQYNHYHTNQPPLQPHPYQHNQQRSHSNDRNSRSTSPHPHHSNEHLNSQGARRQSAATSDYQEQRLNVYTIHRESYSAKSKGTSPKIRLYNPVFKNGEGNFILDTGAEINVVRNQSLHPNIKINTKIIFNVTGIAPNPIVTLGTIKMNIFGKIHTLHVLPNNSLMKEDVILGSRYFKKEKAAILFDEKILRVGNPPLIFVPFYEDPLCAIESESSTESENEEHLDRKNFKLHELSPYYQSDSSESETLLSDLTKQRPILTLPFSAETDFSETCPAPDRNIKKPHKKHKYTLPPRSRYPIAIPSTLESPTGEVYFSNIETSTGVFIGNTTATKQTPPSKITFAQEDSSFTSADKIAPLPYGSTTQQPQTGGEVIPTNNKSESEPTNFDLNESKRFISDLQNPFWWDNEWWDEFKSQAEIPEEVNERDLSFAVSDLGYCENDLIDPDPPPQIPTAQSTLHLDNIQPPSSGTLQNWKQNSLITSPPFSPQTLLTKSPIRRPVAESTPLTMNLNRNRKNWHRLSTIHQENSDEESDTEFNPNQTPLYAPKHIQPFHQY